MTPARIDQDMAVTAAALLPPTVTKELRTRYRQLRIMLHSAGLAATYAYVAAKSKAKPNSSNDDESEGEGLSSAYQRVAEGIRIRLGGLGLLGGDPRQASHREVFSKLGEADAVAYARASTEISQLASWLSRLADAMYEPEPSTDDQPDHPVEPPS